MAGVCPLKGQPHTNCRVKRHLTTTPTHEHGRPAETRPANVIHTHRQNTRQANSISRSQTLFKSSNNLSVDSVGRNYLELH